MMSRVMRMSLSVSALALCGALACGPVSPEVTDAGTPDGGGDGAGGQIQCGVPEPVAIPPEDLSGCTAHADDYRPRENASAQDVWPACISDDNTYHRIGESISTLARVAAFEEIAQLLWRDGRVPTPEDFLQARVIYAQEQGLDSRVQRREDWHYAAPAGGAKCSEAGIPEAHPDRCVGPSKLLPILNDAFARGAQGESPLLHARRIESALLWFLYVSTLSEVMTCTQKPQDCDSAWAYYTGGAAREETGLGLSREVQRLAEGTHDAAYDGLLAVRCWRNLDNEGGVAADTALRDRAFEQLDRALLRGLSRITHERFERVRTCTGEPDVIAAEQAFLEIWVPLLEREATERDPALAAELRSLAPDRSIPALESLFPCP